MMVLTLCFVWGGGGLFYVKPCYSSYANGNFNVGKRPTVGRHHRSFWNRFRERFSQADLEPRKFEKNDNYVQQNLLSTSLYKTKIWWQ